MYAGLGMAFSGQTHCNEFAKQVLLPLLNIDQGDFCDKAMEMEMTLFKDEVNNIEKLNGYNICADIHIGTSNNTMCAHEIIGGMGMPCDDEDPCQDGLFCALGFCIECLSPGTITSDSDYCCSGESSWGSCD